MVEDGISLDWLYRQGPEIIFDLWFDLRDRREAERAIQWFDDKYREVTDLATEKGVKNENFEWKMDYYMKITFGEDFSLL